MGHLNYFPRVNICLLNVKLVKSPERRFNVGIET